MGIRVVGTVGDGYKCMSPCSSLNHGITAVAVTFIARYENFWG